MIKISYNLYKFPVRNELTASTKTLFRSLSTSVNEEYSPEPNYPPILDLSRKARKYREVQAWHDKIQNLGTVEEKMIELNMPRFYGWKCHMLKEGVIPYNAMSFVQHITRTHFINGLPALYQRKELDDVATACLNEVKSQFSEALLYELQRELPIDEDAEPQQVEYARSQSVIQQLHTMLSTCLNHQIPHLKQVQADSKPRIEAAWVAGGMDPPNNVRNARKGAPWLKEDADDPVDRHFQYIGHPLLQVRSDAPLKPFVDLAESENQDMEVPSFTHDPQVFFFNEERRHVTNIPGFWPGDKQQFGLLSFHARSFLTERPEHYGSDEHLEALHAQAILASYAWLLPQATYLGFNTFNELTYPLATQTVFTDGKTWSMYAYQMNTTLVSEHASGNPRRNICWSTEPMKLFETIQDGKLVGLNENVLKTLLKFYINSPAEREGVELRPYLNPDCPLVANIEEQERRVFLENLFKYLCTNRPRHRPLPEIWDWEYIYKIKFNTRPMDARRRYFELWQNPWKRRLDDHARKYVPKVLRDNRKEDKFEKTFYP